MVILVQIFYILNYRFLQTEPVRTTNPPTMSETGHVNNHMEFGNGGGEVDMLIGFFLMNGACIGMRCNDIYPLNFDLQSSS